MIMKNFITKYVPWIIIAVMLLSLIPGLFNRISHENANNNVVISIHHNNMLDKLSYPKFSETLDNFKDIGVNMVSVMEEDLNFLVSKGDLTVIKYNVLRHKYDEESMEIAELVAKNCPETAYDSYVVLVARDYMKKRLSYSLPRMYGKADYAKAGSYRGMDLYVFYDGRKELWDYSVGFNEGAIADMKDRGFNVTLIHKVKNYAKQDYIQDIEALVKKYDIKYLNLKEDNFLYDDKDKIFKNYEMLSDVITDNDMTLVVTENTNQLSNQKFFGYSFVYNSALQKTGKVLRSYETNDESQQDESKYKYRTEQFFNSTMDRNIRFVTVTMLEAKKSSYDECADYTLKAVETYKNKIEKQGFTVNKETQPMSYSSDMAVKSASCAVIMLMCILIAFGMITGMSSFILTVIAVITALLAYILTLFVIPQGLIALYPTAYSVVMPCFIMTALLYVLKNIKDRLPLYALCILMPLFAVAMLLLASIGQGNMLSGMDYYVNNLIFRGIKLSLLVPTVYTAIIFYFMFIKTSSSSITTDIKNVLNARIKVYWMIIAALIGAAGVYYIIRSGNVSKISGAEHFMRTTLTEIFAARPRTKEFLIGYPALVLLVYYVKQHKIDIINWIAAVGASILVTSVSNSFCHVFTNYLTIVSRTLNGLIVGIVVSLICYIGNLIIIKLAKRR